MHSLGARRGIRITIVLVALLLLLAACAGGSSESAQPARGFNAALGAESAQDFSELVDEQMNSVLDDEITRCMKNEGFEYTPDPPWNGGSSGRVGDQGKLSDQAYASEFGFGIWESFNGLGGLSLPDPTTIKSANRDHLESLGEAEVAAWRDQQRTCTRQGWEAQDQFSSSFNPFFAAQAEIREAVAADSRVVAAEADWVGCMGGAGFSFPARNEMFFSLMGEFRGLVENPGSEAVAAESQPEASEESLAFRHREIAIAEASFICSRDLRAIEAAVQFDLEEERLASDPSIIQALDELEKLREG